MSQDALSLVREHQLSEMQYRRKYAKRGAAQILLNLADVSYVDRSGIGELLSGFTTVNGGGGQLKLLNLPMRVKEVLQRGKLYTVFDVHEDEGLAVRSFSPPRPQPAPAQERPGSHLL